MGDSVQRAKIKAQFATHAKARRERQRQRTDANRQRRLERHIERHPADSVALEAKGRR